MNNDLADRLEKIAHYPSLDQYSIKTILEAAAVLRAEPAPPDSGEIE